MDMWYKNTKMLIGGIEMKKFSLIFFIAGIASLCYYFGTLSVGIPFGMFFLMLGVLLLFIGFVYLVPIDNRYLKKFKYPIKIFKILALIFVISFIIVESVIVYSGLRSTDAKAPYVVILGAQVRGETPSNTLYRRLQAGLAYIKKHPDTKIILSGGKGPGEKISEAEAMKNYLVNNGVDEGRIIEEDKSLNTLQNLENTKKIIDDINRTNGTDNNNIVLVTSNFHMFRAKFLAERAGLKAYGCPSSILYWLIPGSYVREYFAVFKSLLFDRP